LSNNNGHLAVYDKVLNIEDLRLQAVIDRNIELLADLVDDDLVYIHSNGSVDTKKTYLELIENKVKYHSLRPQNREVQKLNNEIIVLHGTMYVEYRLVNENNMVDLELFYSGFWRINAKRLTFVRWQATRIA